LASARILGARALAAAILAAENHDCTSINIESIH